MKFSSPLLWFIIFMLIIAGVTYLGPAEATLGTNVRVVYLHGAWVWASLAAFIAAGTVGLLAFLLRRKPLHSWSRAIGRTGLLFWISYLPISLWAMQANWNGLFLAEPRWRMALIFAIGGLLLQIGLTLLENPLWASGFNIAYIIALLLVLRTTANVMHPPAPMLESDAWRIQLYFFGLTALTLFATWQIVRIFITFERSNV
ncbi:MAG: hypothetical protein ISR60_01140 [Anaerolineales bacterium]|nr:hypothetical protein [Anaerolineales bacterium]